jgi:hypothetical protein
MTIKSKDIYKPRRRWWWTTLRIVFTVLAILLLLCITLFFWLRRYAVPQEDGSVVLQFSRPASVTASPDDISPGVQAMTTDDPEPTSTVQPAQNLESLRAIYVPAADVTAEKLPTYVDRLEEYNADSLVLCMKPESGQLSWLSSAQTAISYDTNGSFDIAETLNGLKEEDIYLVAELSCCVDDLMAARNSPVALQTEDGTVYTDSTGSWLDPANPYVLTYMEELIADLVQLGFDEILFNHVAYPYTETALTTAQGSVSDPVEAVTALAAGLQDCVDALQEDNEDLDAVGKDTTSETDSPADVDNATSEPDSTTTSEPEDLMDSPDLSDIDDSETQGSPLRISARVSDATVHNGAWKTTGQSLDDFAQYFDRLYCVTDAGAYMGDLGTFSAVFGAKSTPNRFVPMTDFVPEDNSFCILD